MDEQRQQAYLELIQALLQCESGTEADILQAHLELVDEGLVMMLHGVAHMLIESNDPKATSTIQWLTNFANQLAQGLGLNPEPNPDNAGSSLNFLMTIFRAIAESGENPQVVYPLFRDNLPLLDEPLIPILTTWVQAKFAELDEDRKQLIATVIFGFANLIQQFRLGSRLINLEIALECYRLALEVYTRAAFPEQWATTQMNLAVAYENRIRGERAANLEVSIDCYRLALEVYTREAFPEQWAMTQMNLAGAYRSRIREERAANLEESIACYQLALEVCTREAFPEYWAGTQMNLAVAYESRIREERAANLEESIECYRLALEVYTRTAFPEDWAMTQMGLANAYRIRIREERAANLEESIACYRLALEVYTREAFPEQWAKTQMGLANAYESRIREERAANLEESIACYRLALEVYTREAFPEQWAGTQMNLAILYAKEGQNEVAIQHYQRTLEIFQPEAFPIYALNANGELGNIYFQQGEWQQAIDTYALAIQAAETSRSWATDEDSRQRILREALSVYENTIQAYINLGQIDKAITTSERARSRQLLDFMWVKDLYTDAEIPAEVQTYLVEYEALQQQIQAQQILPTTDNPDNPRRQLTTITRDSRALTVVTETVRDLEAQKQAVWRKIWALDPELADKRQITPIDLPTIQNLIKTPDTAILNFYTTTDDTHIFIITQDRPPQIHTCKGQGLEQFQVWLQESWLEPYLNSKSNWLKQIPTILAEVAQRLELDTLVSKLDGISSLIIIPHLYLHQIPFAAIPLNPLLTSTPLSERSRTDGQDAKRPGGLESGSELESGELLGDKFTIRYTPSCQILKYCDDRPPIAHTQHGTIENADGTLPGAGFEGANIATLFKVANNYRLQGRTQATIQGFQALMKQPDRPITNLHFANHAQSRLDNPLESALQLADGNIGLDRLMISRYLNLHEVFLSCCETHLGTTKITDDILTIATGFLSAGARSVISTLWAVDDLATALFSIFYFTIVMTVITVLNP
jgi:CHAT domain-containing protein